MEAMTSPQGYTGQEGPSSEKAGSELPESERDLLAGRWGRACSRALRQVPVSKLTKNIKAWQKGVKGGILEPEQNRNSVATRCFMAAYTVVALLH